MLFLFRVALIILLACGLAMLGHYGAGHVIVFISQYRLDLALSTLIIFVILLFLLIYYSIRLTININRIPNKLKQWRLKQALLQSRKYLNNAGINFVEGKYGSAYKNAMNSINKEINKDNQFLALMLGYKSCGYMRNHVKEGELLQKIETYQEQKWQLAKYVAIAENQYLDRKYNQCLDNLNKAILIDKKHIPSRKIMLKTYIHLRNYEKAFEELSWLTKYDYIEKHKADKYKINIYGNLFDIISDEAELFHFYRKLDKADKENQVINKFYLNALIRLKQYRVALDLLDTIDKHNFILFDSLLKLVKLLEDSSSKTNFINAVNSIILRNPNHHMLYLALGIVYFKNKDYLACQKYLNMSIAIKPSSEAYVYLLYLAQETNDSILRDNSIVLLRNFT